MKPVDFTHPLSLPSISDKPCYCRKLMPWILGLCTLLGCGIFDVPTKLLTAFGWEKKTEQKHQEATADKSGGQSPGTGSAQAFTPAKTTKDGGSAVGHTTPPATGPVGQVETSQPLVVVETPKNIGGFINQLTALPDSARQELSPSQQNIINETFRNGLPLVKRAVEDHDRLHRDSALYSRSTSTESVSSLRGVLTAYDMHKRFLSNYASATDMMKSYEPYIARARAIVNKARNQ